MRRQLAGSMEFRPNLKRHRHPLVLTPTGIGIPKLGKLRLASAGPTALMESRLHQNQRQQRHHLHRRLLNGPSLPPKVIAAIQTLGLSPKTPWSQASAAYEALIAQYHPDKVAHLGPELREVAAKKSLELNLAIKTIREFLGK